MQHCDRSLESCRPALLIPVAGRTSCMGNTGTDGKLVSIINSWMYSGKDGLSCEVPCPDSRPFSPIAGLVISFENLEFFRKAIQKWFDPHRRRDASLLTNSFDEPRYLNPPNNSQSVFSLSNSCQRPWSQSTGLMTSYAWPLERAASLSLNG